MRNTAPFCFMETERWHGTKTAIDKREANML